MDNTTSKLKQEIEKLRALNKSGLTEKEKEIIEQKKQFFMKSEKYATAIELANKNIQDKIATQVTAKMLENKELTPGEKIKIGMREASKSMVEGYKTTWECIRAIDNILDDNQKQIDKFLV